MSKQRSMEDDDDDEKSTKMNTELKIDLASFFILLGKYIF